MRAPQGTKRVRALLGLVVLLVIMAVVASAHNVPKRDASFVEANHGARRFLRSFTSALSRWSRGTGAK